MSYDICILGLGYIGLPTASIFANRGKKVLGVDVVPNVVETINRGKIHIKEPDLDILVRDAIYRGNLFASLKPAAAQTFIVAVPTPFKSTPDNPRSPDLSYVESATRSIAPFVEAGNLIILESTSPVGTTELMREWLIDELARLRPSEVLSLGHSLLFAHCPERILPGKMLNELVTNDRIAGGLTPSAAEAARDLYRTFCVGEIFLTDARTAEMCKLTENASRDVGIAFANELSLICDRLGIDVWKLIDLANRHPRVKILQPGPGVGGHCIAVDPWFIVDTTPDLARLIRTAREINDNKPQHVINRVMLAAQRTQCPVIVCLGLTFKADVDDLRESPAMKIVEYLAAEKIGRLIVVEPYISELPGSLEGQVELASFETAFAAAEIIVLLVDHQEFLNIKPINCEGKVVIDTRGVWR
jgi:UDP-N-acetyl-D-mannosaminuronic acid dehydrogenase